MKGWGVVRALCKICVRWGQSILIKLTWDVWLAVSPRVGSGRPAPICLVSDYIVTELTTPSPATGSVSSVHSTLFLSPSLLDNFPLNITRGTSEGSGTNPMNSANFLQIWSDLESLTVSISKNPIFCYLKPDQQYVIDNKAPVYMGRIWLPRQHHTRYQSLNDLHLYICISDCSDSSVVLDYISNENVSNLVETH